MKTIKLSMLFAALLISLTSLTSKASDFINLIVMDIPMKSIIQVTAPEKITASIVIYDENKTILFNDRFDANSSLTRAYDFSNLNDGIYTFQSTAGLMNITKKIEIKDSKIEILSRETKYKPLFSVNDDKLKVNFFNQNKEDIEFKLESSDRIFYKGKGNSTSNFQKHLDISNLMRGEYYASIKVGENVYYHSFRKN